MSLAAMMLAVLPATGSAEPPHHEPFRVLSYNVRQVNAADTGIYQWAERSPDVMQVIADNDPDIFGVQESSSPLIQEDLVAAFDADYDRYQPPNGSPKTIFFRRTRFTRLEDDPALGEGYIGLPNPYDEGDACHPNASGRTAAWVKLRDLVSGRGYLVVNVHVAHAAACFAARNAGAMAVQALIAEKRGDLSVLVMGDLNTDPQSATAPDGDDTIAILEAPQEGYRLARSSRHPGTTDETTATFNSSWKSPSSSYARLDWIFTSVQDATTYWPIVDRREIDGISPSDHFAIAATIRTAPFAPDPLVDDRGDGPGASLSFADVDGDGAADKMSWDPGVQGGAVRVHLADGAGGFGDPVLGDPAPAGVGLHFADVDGDGCSDRIEWSASVGGGALRVAWSACDGTFGAPLVSDDALVSSGERLFFAPIDDDACADRIAWNPGASEGRARVALSGCDGTFAPEIAGVDDGLSTNTDAAMGFADVDGDGLYDKIVWDPAAYSGRARVFAGNGDGTFTFASEHTGGTSVVSTSRFHYGDIDADGHADKIFWRDNFRQGRPQLYRGGVEGFDGHPAMVDSGTSESPSNRWFLADIDGSGSDDFIGWDPQVDGATRAWLALVHAPDPDPEEPPDPEDPSGDDTGAASSADASGGAGGDDTAAMDGPGDTTGEGATDGPGADLDESGCACDGAPGRHSSRGWLVGLGIVVLGATRRRRAPR